MAISLPEDIPQKKRLCFTFLLMVGAPFLLYHQKLIFLYHEQKLKLYPRSKTVNKKWEESKRTLYNYIKSELGLESLYQIIGQLILIALAYSQTSTNEVFSAYFKEDKDYKIIFLCSSVGYSFISCVKSHITALKGCRERFPFMTNIIVAIYCAIGISARVLAIMMYFAVPLGLFNLLRHLQGEQFPWNPYLVYNFVGANASGSISFGDLVGVEWNQLDRFVDINLWLVKL